MLRKDDGALRFEWTAQQVHDRVRALVPWPGAYATHQGERLKIHRTALFDDVPSFNAAKPGDVLEVDERGIHVACVDRSIALLEVQQAGRRRVAATDYASGRTLLERLENGA